MLLVLLGSLDLLLRLEVQVAESRTPRAGRQVKSAEMKAGR